MMTPTHTPCQDTQTLVSKIAELTLRILQPSQTPVSIALTGGRTASAIYQSICAQALDIPVRWRNVHFFWGDERCVPFADPQSNFGLAQEFLLKPLRIHPVNIHSVPTQFAPEEAASRASAQYLEFLKNSNLSSLRLVLLSMGEDGHIASIFPGAMADSLQASTPYSPVSAPKAPSQRVTLNFAALSQAEELLVAVVGSEKQAALEKSLTSDSTPLGQLLQLRSALSKPTNLLSVF